MVAGVRRHHLISLREHIDRTRGIGHDLVHQPILQGTDEPHVPAIEQQHGVPSCVLLLDNHLVEELRLSNHERVMSRRWSSLAMLPVATIILARASPSAPPQHLPMFGSRKSARQPELGSALALTLIWGCGREQNCNKSNDLPPPRRRSKIRADRLIAKMATERTFGQFLRARRRTSSFQTCLTEN